MTNGKETRAIALVTCVLAFAAVALQISTRQHRLENEFNSVVPGTSVNEITAKLGTPWRTTKCGETFGANKPRGCDRELIYAHPLASLLPQYWAYRYDQNGRLLDKYKYVSP